MRFRIFRSKPRKWEELHDIIVDYVNNEREFTNLIYNNSVVVLAHYLAEKLYKVKRYRTKDILLKKGDE